MYFPTIFRTLIVDINYLCIYFSCMKPELQNRSFSNDAGDCTGLRLAKLKVNSKFKAPCKTSILYPADGGNMHCFTAKTACAVLDVLGPPYCDPDGRHCQYYYDFPFANMSGIMLYTSTDLKFCALDSWQEYKLLTLLSWHTISGITSIFTKWFRKWRSKHTENFNHA